MAIGVVTSSSLLAFSAFLFQSLAVVKRCAELVSLKEAGAGATLGRDYRVSDLVVLWPLGGGAALGALTVVVGFMVGEQVSPRRAGGVALTCAGYFCCTVLKVMDTCASIEANF